MTVSDPLTTDHPHALCVREAVACTFSAFCGEPPLFIDHDETANESVIVGIISLMSERSCTMMLSLPCQTAEALALGFVGMEIPFDSDDMGDVVGELTNILAGSVIAKLEAIGISAEMSLPTVMRGSGMTHLLQEGMTSLPLHFEVPQGAFIVRIVAGEPNHGLTRTPGRA